MSTVTTTQCRKKWGEPGINFERKFMVLWDVPTELEIGVLPKRLYCNKDMVAPLGKAFKNLIDRGFVKELKTFDGCFNNRDQRGYPGVKSMHAWGIAIDVNASWNQLGKKPTLSPGFVKCFTDAGFEWGGTWQRLDGMHFQLASI